MKKTDTYVAVLGDVIASRRLPPRARARLQRELQAALRTELNRRWRPAIAARFAIARGDEIEGLLHDAAASAGALWDIAHWIRARFSAVDWIIAAARGPITTALAATALEVDGPCFHEARAALDEAKRTRQVFVLRGFPPTTTALAGYYSALYWSWTPRQRRTAGLLRVWDRDRDQVRERLKVHPTAVSHMKRRLAWPLVAAGDTMFRAALLEAS